MQLKNINPRSAETVHTHTHTSDLVKVNKKCRGKDNVVLPCGFYDTG